MKLISIGRIGHVVGATGTIAIRESTFPLQWARQKEEYANIRGFDVGRDNKKIPRITNQDAIELVEYWDEQGEDLTHADAAVFRMFATHVDVLTAGHPAGELFSKPQFFWDGLQRHAVALASTTAIPSRWDMISEAVSEAIDELPDRVGFLWPDWLTDVLKWGGIGLGAGIILYAVVKGRK